MTVHHGGNTALAIVLDLSLDGVQLMIEDAQEAVNVLALEIPSVGVLSCTTVSCTTVRQAGGVAGVWFTGLGEAERHALIRLTAVRHAVCLTWRTALTVLTFRTFATIWS